MGLSLKIVCCSKGEVHLPMGAGILRNAESCRGVICRKSSAEHSANYPSLLFCIPQRKNSAFPQIANYHSLTLYNKCAKLMYSSIRPPAVPSLRILCGPFAKEQGSFLQFRLTSKTLRHSKCHIISLVDVIGFNLYNRCDSSTDDRTVATDRRDDHIM